MKNFWHRNKYNIKTIRIHYGLEERYVPPPPEPPKISLMRRRGGGFYPLVKDDFRTFLASVIEGRRNQRLSPKIIIR